MREKNELGFMPRLRNKIKIGEFLSVKKQAAKPY